MPCGNPDPTKFEVGVSSSVVNALNFVLCDVILLNLIFSITGDIAGLLNAKSARDRRAATLNGSAAPNHILDTRSPPLVGVGLTCTRRSYFWILAAIRTSVLFGILGTNFLIDGTLCQVVRESQLKVVVPGQIPGITRLSKTTEEVAPLMQRRRSCLGRLGSEFYYAELRDQHSCESRLNLIQGDPVFFSIDVTNYTIRVPANTKCTMKVVQRVSQEFVCPGYGVLVCPSQSARFSKNPVDRRITLSDSCRGVVKVDDKVLLCNKGPGLFPGRSDAPIYSVATIKREGGESVPGETTTLQSQPQSKERWAVCHQVRSFDYMDNGWTQIITRFAFTVKDAIDTYYGAAVEERTVRIADDTKMKQVAVIEYSWFWIVGAIILALFILIAVDFSMRCSGLRPIAHNEFGLGSLIAASAVDRDARISNVAEFGRPRLTIERQRDGVLRCRRTFAIDD